MLLFFNINFLKIIYLFIYFWPCWLFIAACGLSLVAVNGGYPCYSPLFMALPFFLLHHLSLFYSFLLLFFFLNLFIYFIYFWLHWVLVAARGLSLSCGDLRLLIVVASLAAEHGLLGARASVVVAHGLRCSAACGIFLDQGLNLCPLHWQMDS